MWIPKNNSSYSHTVIVLIFVICCSLWQKNLAFVAKKPLVGKHHGIPPLTKSTGRRSTPHSSSSVLYSSHPWNNATDTMNTPTAETNPPTTDTNTASWKLEDYQEEGTKTRDKRRWQLEQLEQLLFRSDGGKQQQQQQSHVVEEQWMLKKNNNRSNKEEEEEEREQVLSSWWNNGNGLVRARLLLLCAAALYGTNFSFVKILGETDMSVGVSSTLRFGLAALATLPWLLQVGEKEETESTITSSIGHGRRWDRLTDPSGVEWKSTVAGFEVGMWVCLGYIAQAIGLETTPASKSAFLCSLAVVIVPILDVLIGKSLQSKQVLGAILAVVGVGFLELGGGGGSGDAIIIDSSNNIIDAATNLFSSLSYGDYCSLVQPLAFGMGFWRMEHAMHEYPTEANRSTAAQLLAVFLGSLVYLIVSTTAPIIHPLQDGSSSLLLLPTATELQSFCGDPLILFSLFWTGIVTTALTVYMETVALKTLSAAETTIIFSTEPLWGTACAVVVMGEHLGIDAAVGAGLILFGCLFSNLGLDGMLSFVDPTKKELGGDESSSNIIVTGQEEEREETGRESSVLFPVSSAAGIYASFLAFVNRGGSSIVNAAADVADSAKDLLG